MHIVALKCTEVLNFYYLFVLNSNVCVHAIWSCELGTQNMIEKWSKHIPIHYTEVVQLSAPPSPNLQK